MLTWTNKKWTTFDHKIKMLKQVKAICDLMIPCENEMHVIALKVVYFKS